MKSISNIKDSIPDITNAQKSSLDIALDWVGMGDVEVLLNYQEGQQSFQGLPAKAGMYVNLKDPSAKGIHMSRLYLLASQALEAENLAANDIKSLLEDMVKSQKDVSNQARLSLSFHLPVKRKALVSDLYGLRHYPVTLEADVDEQGNVTQTLGFEVTYSSTCPCSAALSRQLIKQKWTEDHTDVQGSVSVGEVADWLEKEESMVATPHAQRSRAQIRLKLQSGQNLEVISFINKIEEALQTPVQTAVKREDEQEFARLNGNNLMFCEDAGRKVYASLINDERLQDFWLRVEHLESLHSHNAVSEASKYGKKI